MAAIDLYSGIGGWTLGLKLAGIPVLSSYEWWKDANNTHNKNFNSHHSEVNIRTLELATLPDPESVNFVVGSPPCTQFSLSNRGGKGDIKDGLIDIRKFLEVVDYMQPKYWAMENVPRVAEILEKQIQKGSLRKFRHLFGDIKVYNSSDYGVPQDRKRMIAGRLPFDLLDEYSKNISQVNLRDVIQALHVEPYVDPIYGIAVPGELLSDHVLEPNLSIEEERINKDSKTHHPVYNRMSFPDRLDRPSRTITALCTRVSRESIVIQDLQNNIRRLTIRERGNVQSFPINYQFFSKTYPNKIKMIGNAIPPVLTFYIAQAMLETPINQVLSPNSEVVRERLVLGNEMAVSSIPENQGAKYNWNRSFWLAIQGLRFGSGVRFELKNSHQKEKKETFWRVNFFYGNSKNIKAKELSADLFKRAIKILRKNGNEVKILEVLNEISSYVKNVNEQNLQLNWTNTNRDYLNPIDLADQLSEYAMTLQSKLEEVEGDVSSHVFKFIELELKNDKGEIDNKKILESHLKVFAGILMGSMFNSILKGDKIDIRLPKPQLTRL